MIMINKLSSNLMEDIDWLLYQHSTKKGIKILSKKYVNFNQNKIINRYFQMLFWVKLILAQTALALAVNNGQKLQIIQKVESSSGMITKLWPNNYVIVWYYMLKIYKYDLNVIYWSWRSVSNISENYTSPHQES